MKVRVTVWNEYVDELEKPLAAECYPDGIHIYFKKFLEASGFDVTTATLYMPEHGLTEDILDRTDVLIWFGHIKHHEVSDEVVERIHRRILKGMGLILLHSSHVSKIMRKALGTSGMLKFREDGKSEILWVVNPSHPIAEGIDEYVVIPKEEVYGEFFDIPQPDALVFIGWFEGGEVFRSGCCYQRGLGKIFYFQPGHEEYPVYHLEQIQKIIVNAVRWATPIKFPVIHSFFHEPIMNKHQKNQD